MTKKSARHLPSNPPPLDNLPLVHGRPEVGEWLEHYWHKLNLPREQLRYLAVTDDRSEFARWTGRRLNPMALGCYCYLPVPGSDAAPLQQSVAVEVNKIAVEPDQEDLSELAGLVDSSLQPALPGFAPEISGSGEWLQMSDAPDPQGNFRHLIFIEPELESLGTEVTVAHELIHLSDRVKGTPRKHRCHGHDSISVDEAAITGRDPELLRTLLAEETVRREESLRRIRPYRYIYECPSCGKVYPRVRKYTRAVSCGRCDHQYNAAFLLQLREATPADQTAL